MDISYTSISQSESLIKLGIDKSTADMCYINPKINSIPSCIPYKRFSLDEYSEIIPAWSLNALLKLLPNISDAQPILTRGKISGRWYCYYKDEMDTQTYDNPLDAVFEMITWLKDDKVI